MRKLLLLALIVFAALFLWNRSNLAGTQWAQLLRSGGQAAHSSGGGAVRQWEHAPDDITAGEAVLPQPQSGAAALNSVRQGLQNSGKQ
ncbi:MAG: hypothetical protein ABSA52_05360 [Candidatus Binatia bacterium]|jgi:hypothetical protein